MGESYRFRNSDEGFRLDKIIANIDKQACKVCFFFFLVFQFHNCILTLNILTKLELSNNAFTRIITES